MFRKSDILYKHKKSSRKNEKKETKQEEIKPNYFEKLPAEILKHNLFELTETKKTAVTFSKTSKRHHKLFQSQIDLPLFIHHVAFGEQDQAEAILKKWNESKDEIALNYLLTKKSDVTDIAGKNFKSITAFQYALWALDSHMCYMLLKYLPEEKAKFQLEEWEEKGITYTNPTLGDQKEKNITREKHFDFSPLIAALRDYVDNVEARNWDWNKCEAVWCKNVGGAQKKVPAHVAQEYCRKDRAFYPVPEFKEATLPRHLAFYNDVSTTNSSWFSDTGLGSKVAVIRGPWNEAFGGQGNGESYPHPRMSGAWIDWRETARADLEAIIALSRVARTNELRIKEILLKGDASAQKQKV